VLGDTPDGKLIDVVEAPWRMILELLIKDPRARFQIESRKLEEMVACAYKDHGFDEVVLTPRSGDHGRDVIATKRGRFSVRIIDSVKALGEGKRVRYDDVRALMGVLSSDRGVSKAIVTTTAEFAPGIATDPLIAPFLPTRLQLVNGTELSSWLGELRAKARRE
jgi:restriction system protein